MICDSLLAPKCVVLSLALAMLFLYLVLLFLASFSLRIHTAPLPGFVFCSGISLNFGSLQTNMSEIPL